MFFQDEDTLDTWFSSALWTWSTLVDPKTAEDPKLSLQQILEGSADFRKFHPTAVLETGYDILFFWVARMILMTTYVMQRCGRGRDERDRIPFRTVYLHGLVRTRDGRKMSKSDPETCIDPLEMIRRYGADALRLSMIVGQSPGADSRLYEEKIAGYRNFVNKLWNAARYVLLQCERAGMDPRSKVDVRSSKLSLPDRWILSRAERVTAEVTGALEQYRLSEVGERLYDFVWSEFCDWYLELGKEEPNVAVLLYVLRRILILLHPYAPFVTEEVWSRIGSGELLVQESWPASEGKFIETEVEVTLQAAIAVTSAVRRIRAEQGVDPDRKVDVVVCTQEFAQVIEDQADHIKRLAGVETLEVRPTAVELPDVVSAFLSGIDVHVKIAGAVDLVKLRKERETCAKYRDGLLRELENAGFLKRAPARVVEEKRVKLAEVEDRLRKIEGRLVALS